MTEAAAVLPRAGIDELITALIAEGYRVIGPTLRDDAIVLAELSSGEQLPSGWGVETGPGRYRLRRRDDMAVFGHSAGPQSWKQFLHPPRRQLWSADGDEFTPASESPVRYAFLGVRACDLAAIATLATVLRGGPRRGRAADAADAPDAGGSASQGGRTDRGDWPARWPDLFIVAASCTEPGEVCFCASLGTGPAPGPGYDLALTERVDDAGHRFVVEVGSAAGERVLSGLGTRAATGADVAEARAAVQSAASEMGRYLPAIDVRELLRESRESPLWEEVANRCLTCGNCTMVCPTCFCTTTEDSTDLTGQGAQRSQRWASCFELDFSYLHGGSVRVTGASRYRQWITHKLSTWHDQFGGSGCVGCGRCIAWCPTGIDITEEVAKLARHAGEGPPGDDRANAGESAGGGPASERRSLT